MLHPKTDPDLKIRVLKWAMGGNELTDDYIRTKRFRETKKLMKHFVDDINKKNLFSIGLSGDVKHEKMYYDMSYSAEDIIKKYPEKIYISSGLFIFFDITEENVDEVCKKLYKMVKYMQDADIGEVEMEVLFFSEDYFAGKDVVKIEKEEMGPLGIANFQSIYSEYSLTMFNISKVAIGLEDYRGIKSYKDIKKAMYYKKFTGTINTVTDRRDFEWINK